jgi:hypothetical protein
MLEGDRAVVEQPNQPWPVHAEQVGGLPTESWVLCGSMLTASPCAIASTTVLSTWWTSAGSAIGIPPGPTSVAAGASSATASLTIAGLSSAGGSTVRPSGTAVIVGPFTRAYT